MSSRGAAVRGVEATGFVQFPKVVDPRGVLCFVEGGNHIGFDIARVYYIYGVPAGGERAGHAHKTLQQLFVAVSGSFDLVLDDGRNTRVVTLGDPSAGYYVCAGLWRVLRNFQPGSACLVLASERYSENDYIRDYQAFREFAEDFWWR